MKTPSTRPAIANTRPSAAEAEEAGVDAEEAQHQRQQAEAHHAEHAGDHERAELVADLDVEELVGGERAGERGERAEHGLGHDAVTELGVEELADRAERHTLEGANASTRAGLMTRLNELTSESTKAPTRMPSR